MSPSESVSRRQEIKQFRWLEDQTTNIESAMITLFDAAAIIRKSITKCRKWKFTGSLKNLPEKHVPHGSIPNHCIDVFD